MTKPKISIFFIIAILFLGGNLMAQDFLLNGATLELGTKTRIDQVQIINKKNKYIAKSNAMGLFEIRANLGDTLTFIKLYYQDLTFVVQDKKGITINLIRNTNTLNEVRINGRRVVDDLRKDFKNVPPPSGKSSALSYVFSPISSIYNLLSTDGKNARRFSRYYNYEVKESQIDLFFNKSIIKTHTGLEDKALDDFMINYRPDYEIAKNWTSYDGLKWIADSYKKYTANLKSPL